MPATTQRRSRRDRNRRTDPARDAAWLSAVTAREAAEEDLFRRLKDRRVTHVEAHEAMQSMLNDAMHEYTFFLHDVRKLTAHQISSSTVSRQLYDIALKLRGEVAALSGQMVRLGMDERAAAIEEKRIRMFLETFEARALEAGVSREQLRHIANEMKELSA